MIAIAVPDGIDVLQVRNQAMVEFLRSREAEQLVAERIHEPK